MALASRTDAMMTGHGLVIRLSTVDQLSERSFHCNMVILSII